MSQTLDCGIRVVIAEADGRHLGIGYGLNGEILAQIEGEAREEAEVELKAELLGLRKTTFAPRTS